MARKFYDVTRIESLQSTLKRYLKDSGVGWMLRHRDVVQLWNDAVGPEVAERTRVCNLRSGTLYVDIESAALKSEIEQFHSAVIIESIQAMAPQVTIRKLRLRLCRIDNRDEEQHTP